MEKYQWVVYGMDMVGFLILETEAPNMKEAHDNAVALCIINKLDFDIIEPFDRKFADRMQWLENRHNEKATDYFSLGEIVEIVKECPLKGLRGELVYVSESSMQIEVLVSYEGFEGEMECSSYFRGLVKNIKKVD